MGFSSVQKTELQGVIWTLQDYLSTPINLFLDSAYVCGVMHHTETTTVHTSQNLSLISYTPTQCHSIMTSYLFYWPFTFPFPTSRASYCRKQCYRQTASYLHYCSLRYHSTGFCLPCHSPSKHFCPRQTVPFNLRTGSKNC